MNPDPDFNDLDKAVSSLVGSTNKAATQSPAADKTSSQLKPHAGKGKFMDVMHPSSDMTTVIPTTSGTADDTATPYIGKTIDPVSKDIKPDPVPEKNVDDLPVVKQLSPIDDADPKSLVATPDIAETVKPDPLEIAAKKERERVARDDAKQRKAEHKLADKASSGEDKIDDKKDTKDNSKSLFLEDAKVEKRPLGAFNEDSQKISDDNERPALKTKSDKAKNDAQKTTTPPPPPEFDQAVVALEASDEANLEDDKSADSVTDSKPDTKNFSIPPQYKQTDKTKDDSKQSSIYEPDTYNAFADNNTPSNTKPWMWVIIFLGIVALGVALSFGTFFAVGSN